MRRHARFIPGVIMLALLTSTVIVADPRPPLPCLGVVHDIMAAAFGTGGSGGAATGYVAVDLECQPRDYPGPCRWSLRWRLRDLDRGFVRDADCIDWTQGCGDGHVWYLGLEFPGLPPGRYRFTVEMRRVPCAAGATTPPPYSDSSDFTRFD